MASEEPPALEAHLAAVRAQARASYGARAAALREAADRLAAGQLEGREDIRRIAHRLRGIAGSAGHPRLTERAGRLEEAARSPASAFAVVEGARRLARAADAAGPPSAPPAPPPQEPPPPSTRLGLRVVALDDEPGVRRLLEITLVRAAGCAASVYATPTDAMRAILEAPPDLVICDALMPEIDGLTFYRGVRRRAGAVPVLILSAASPEEFDWTLPADPALAWARKPFRPGRLIERIRAFVERARG